MARKFRTDDVVQVKERVRHEIGGRGRRVLQRHDWIGTIRIYDIHTFPYGVQSGKSNLWSWFKARELDLISRPKKGA